MSEQAKGSETPAVDMSKFVPKEEYEKLAGSVKELEGKLDEAKLSLLDPEYIDFLETRKGKQVDNKVKREVAKLNTDGMTSQQILEAATERAKQALMEEVLPQYEKVLRQQGSTIQDILAYIELGECEKRYKDFNDYREDTRKILESSKTPLTIEQAYKQAKLDKLEAEGKLTPKEKEELKAPAPQEKPTGSVPKESMSKSGFKSADDAADDAWNKTIGSGKDTL